MRFKSSGSGFSNLPRMDGNHIGQTHETWQRRSIGWSVCRSADWPNCLQSVFYYHPVRLWTNTVCSGLSVRIQRLNMVYSNQWLCKRISGTLIVLCKRAGSSELSRSMYTILGSSFHESVYATFHSLVLPSARMRSYDNVASTSMQRDNVASTSDNVASTSMRRCLNVIFPLGTLFRLAYFRLGHALRNYIFPN